MRISDWSSDVCSSDLSRTPRLPTPSNLARSSCASVSRAGSACGSKRLDASCLVRLLAVATTLRTVSRACYVVTARRVLTSTARALKTDGLTWRRSASWRTCQRDQLRNAMARSEEHTSELQSLMRISYAVFCL